MSCSLLSGAFTVSSGASPGRPTATVKEPSVSVRRRERRRESRCLEREGGEPTGAEAGWSTVRR